MSSQQDKNQELREVGQWRIVTKLGEGSFGDVYAVTNNKKQQQRGNAPPSLRDQYAMKIEKRQRNPANEVLRMEVWVLKQLTPRFFCQIIDQGQTPQHSYIVMTMLGKPLDDLRRLQPDRRLCHATILKVGIQLMSAFSKLHSAGFIHRDVKPGNMAPGIKRPNMIYLFDFGLARSIYTDSSKKQLRPPRAHAQFRGTYRYCSANAQRQHEQGRVDDLWSVLYSLIELGTGRLPWAGIRPSNSIGIKEGIKDDVLFKGSPASFRILRQQLSQFKYEDDINYVNLALILFNEMKTRNFKLTEPFEWEKNPDQLNTMSTPRKAEEDLHAHRPDEASESIITNDDSAYSSGRSSTNKSNREATVDDTLDDLPENLMNNLDKELKKQQDKPAAQITNPPRNGKNCAADNKDKTLASKK